MALYKYVYDYDYDPVGSNLLQAQSTMFEFRGCVRGTGPAYFKDVCVPVSDIAARSSLRSAERGDLFVPRTRTTKLSRRSFTVAAPVVWNSLPAHLRSPLISRGQFRAGLKTHLFRQAYSLWEHFVLECNELKWTEAKIVTKTTQTAPRWLAYHRLVSEVLFCVCSCVCSDYLNCFMLVSSFYLCNYLWLLSVSLT